MLDRDPTTSAIGEGSVAPGTASPYSDRPDSQFSIPIWKIECYSKPMTVGSAFSASVSAVGNIMVEAHDPWWIIASAAVALHGADPGHLADVDVLLSVADARRILPTIGIKLRHGSAHSMFRSSIFGTWTGTALPVEFMADFHHRSGEAWLPVQPATRQPISVGSAMVFVPERAELQAMLAAFGRPKDMERARSLAAVA